MFFKKKYKILGLVNHLGIMPDIDDILSSEDNMSSFLHSIKKVISFCKDAEIKYLSIYLLGRMYKENYEELHFLKRLINRFQADEFFNDVKFSFVGDWTELNGLQDAVKELIVEEREEISLNLNLFVNYSSREEIIDAGRIIAKKVIKEKLDSDFVNTSAFEELMKGSGPDIALIIFFNNNAFNDFIGFKALRAKFHYIEKSFLDFSEDDVHEALERVGLAKKI